MPPRWIAIVLSLAVFALAWTRFESLAPERTRGTFQGRIPTPYLRFKADHPRVGTALLVHGLSANKEFMQTLGMALSDAGFETYAIDLPGHGDSPVGFSHSAGLEAVGEALDALGPNTVAVGHSLGGALLAELAATHRFRSLLLLSPAPIPLEPFLSDHVLVISGAADAPRVNAFIPGLLEAAGPGAEWRELPHAGHSTSLFDPGALQSVVDWLLPAAPHPIETSSRLGWLALMAAAALIPLLVSGARPAGEAPVPSASSGDWINEIVRWTAALALALVALRFVRPFSWLRLLGADYLVGVLFLAGLVLWGGRRAAVGGGRRVPVRFAAILAGGLAAVYCITALLFAVGSELMHLVPSGSQWWRVPVLAGAGLPIFLYDEQVLRPLQPWWKRWSMYLVTRALLWAAVVTGVLVLRPDSAFLVVVMHFVVVSWIPLWWLAGFVARRTGEAVGPALFAALIQGWVFAAVWVRI